MYNHILLIIIFCSILPFETGWNSKYQFYRCKRDICSCCFEISSMNSTNYNSDTRELHYFPSSSNHMVFLNKNDSKIKLIYNETITIYECPNNLPSIYYYPSLYPVTRNQFQLSIQNVTEDPILVDGIFQKCVHSYCEFKEHRNNMLMCKRNGIKILNFKFTTLVTPQCIQNITFVSIRNISSSILFKSNFFDYAINVVFMQLRGSQYEHPYVRCSTFISMKKLRLLDISSITLRNAKCIFAFNPDVIRITNREQIVWNMCRNRLEVYDIKTVYPFDEYLTQLNATAKLITKNKSERFSNTFLISICVLLILITMSVFYYFVRRHILLSVANVVPIITNRIIQETSF